MSDSDNKDTGEICFRHNDDVGAADASNDNYLSNCFIDTGVLGVIKDCSNPKSILLGRTGVGKSAILMEFDRINDHVIKIKPQDISMNYISSCNILNRFIELGINLDPVFKTLWRHVITIEIIKKVYGLDAGGRDRNILHRFFATFRKAVDTPYKECKDYFDEWNDSFWDDTEKGTTN